MNCVHGLDCKLLACLIDSYAPELDKFGHLPLCPKNIGDGECCCYIPELAKLRHVVALMKDWHAKREAFQRALLAVSRANDKYDAIAASDAAQRAVEEADRVLVAAMKEVTL